MSPNHSNKSLQQVILFDGVCNLCNGFVQFVIKRDPKKIFQFAALQSEYAQNKLSEKGLDFSDIKTIYLLKQEKVYSESDVALEVVKELSGLWHLLSFLKWIPKFVRNPIYRLIAKNRYRLFGKQSKCMVPTPELRQRFYD